MNKLFKELRRREVFRTAGLYVGICWLVIEVASVLLPVFDAPPWLLRGAFIAAVVGFPIMLVLAWFFDITKTGIHLQADPSDTKVEQPGAGKTDFAIIGVLLLALAVSVSLNVKNKTPANVAVEPVSVVVADFTSTVNEPLFEHVLEEAFAVGLGVAPHVAIFARDKARQTSPEGSGLTVTAARALAQSKGIDLIITGSLQPSADGYRITARGINGSNGESAFEIDEKADSRSTVLQAIGELSSAVRKKLGHAESRDPQDRQAKTFMAASLAAGHAYAAARQLEMAGKLEDAVTSYRQATTADPKLGRAFSSLALLQFQLGQTEEAAEHWTQALSLMDTMTHKERLHALGRYAASVAVDYDEAEKIYSELVAAYPSDTAGRANLADVLFQQLDVASAAEEIRSALQIFPADQVSRSRLALYEMYSGNWVSATKEAQKVVDADAQRAAAYLPMAMAALAQGQSDSSRQAYQSLARADDQGRGPYIAELGLADIDLYLGQTSAAQERLITAIETTINAGHPRIAAAQSIALAQSYVAQDNFDAATAALSHALSLSDDKSSTVPAAMIFIRAGDLEAANGIAAALSQKPDAHSRAYALMLKGMILQSEGAQTKAILAMRDGIDLADLWLIRFQIGKAYLQAGSYPEALDELTRLKVRSGEATAVFLNELPTYRLLAELPPWIARAQEALGR